MNLKVYFGIILDENKGKVVGMFVDQLQDLEVQHRCSR